MNLSEKIGIVLYTSTKGHFGNQNLYKYTVNNLKEKILFFDDFYKIAHIKYSKKEEDVKNCMKNFLEKEGFKVISTEGEWAHNDEKKTHWKEYYKDKLKCFSDLKLNKRPYTFFIEDDELISFSRNSIYSFTEAINLLDSNLDYLCVRINRETSCDNKNSTKVSENILVQNVNYTQWGPTFTFQPTIVRTPEWRHSLRIINQNLNILEKVHCEILSGEILKQFSDSEKCFCFFDFKDAQTEHIGILEKHNLYKN